MENTRLRVISNAPLRSGKTRVGTPVDFLLSENVVVGNVLILPRGATLEGEVMRSKKAGRLKGAADLILELVSLNLGGRRYRVYTYQLSVEGGSKKNPAPAIVGSAEVGALAGAVVSAKNGETTASGKAADIGGGAAAGAGVGTLVSVVTPGPEAEPAGGVADGFLPGCADFGGAGERAGGGSAGERDAAGWAGTVCAGGCALGGRSARR